jgi:hypothetical protein
MENRPRVEHTRPDAASDAAVAAAGRMTEALETLERARGHLYAFHQLVDGRRHLHEAELKERRRTHGHPAHTARPQ